MDVVLTRRNGRFSGEAFAVLQMPMQVGGRHRAASARQLHVLHGSSLIQAEVSEVADVWLLNVFEVLAHPVYVTQAKVPAMAAWCQPEAAEVLPPPPDRGAASWSGCTRQHKQAAPA